MADDKRRGLGSGLEAIFGPGFNDFDDLTNQVMEESPNSAEEIDLSRIYPNPYQPRKEFSEEGLNELADSIREHGVFQPIFVKPTDTGYVLLAGERRVRAAKMAGLQTIPAIVKEFTDNQLIELSLLENIQREDLSAVEEALSYRQLIDKIGYTQEELAKRVGKSRAHVTNTLRLLNLPEEVRQMVVRKELTMGQVRPLVTVEDPAEQIRLAKMIKNMDLSARQAEMLAKRREETPKPKPAQKVNPELKKVEHRLQSYFGTKVKVSDNAIAISYKGYKDLNRILEILDLLDEE